MEELPSQVQEVFDRIEHVRAEGREPDRAMLEHVRGVVDGFPEHPWAWLALAEVAAAVDDRVETLRAVGQAVALAPDDAKVALYGVDELFNAGCREDAARLVAHVRETADLEDPEILGRVLGQEGWMRQWSGDAVGAEGLLRRALEILPEYAFHWRALALCLAIQDQFAEAETIATEGCRRFPESVSLPPLLRAIRGEPPLPD